MHPIRTAGGLKKGVLVRSDENQRQGLGGRNVPDSTQKCECRIKAITPAFQAGDGSSILPTRSKRTFPYGSPISADERNLDFVGVATQPKFE